MNTTNSLASLTLAHAIELVPSIGAKSPAPHIRSKSYNFTSTEEVANHMLDMGYTITSARASNTKSDLWKNYGAHIISFQHPELYIKDSAGGIEARPTIVMTNSHDGSRPVQFDMGMFRLVCSNGLMVKSMELGGYRERHSRMDLAGVKSMLDEKLTAMPKLVGQINDWAQYEMTPTQRKEFATRALAIRVGQERQAEEHEIRSLLTPRRAADERTDLWTTFNVVQEGLIRGGFMMGERTARAVTNPWADMTINRALWALAEEVA